jgi:outer membrane protein
MLAGTCAATLLSAQALRAETVGGALIKAYFNNPDINQQRAAVRAADEEIPKASADYRPKISAEADSPLLERTSKTVEAGAAAAASGNPSLPKPRGLSATLEQNLWNGNRTRNLVSQADSRVMAAREQLRNTEQNVLIDGAQAYMDVLRDTAILELDRAQVHVEKEEVRETQDRFVGGEVTMTDVEQAKAALAGAEADALVAQSTLEASIAGYRRVIGEEPKSLSPAKALSKALPKSVRETIAISQAEHPSITAALHGVDAAALEIKIDESRLYPSADLKGLIDRRINASGDTTVAIPFTASLAASVSVPVYDGGLVSATTRQAKEQLGQQELSADLQHDKVRAAAVAAWVLHQSAPGLVAAALAQVAASETALRGVREEAKFGQRTTFDELVAAQNLLKARIQLVSAQRDEVVASYSVMAAIGRLSITRLGLATTTYDPTVHYNQVKDKWFGLRTPVGR